MWNLSPIDIALGDKNFEGFIDANNKHYFAERVPTYGVLDFGLVGEDQRSRISLAANGITSPLLVESVIANVPGSNAEDEVKIYLYRSGQQIAYQRFSKNEMPYRHPPVILTPDLEVEVEPTRQNAIIFVYVRPVQILFRAVTNPT